MDGISPEVLAEIAAIRRHQTFMWHWNHLDTKSMVGTMLKHGALSKSAMRSELVRTLGNIEAASSLKVFCLHQHLWV